MNPTKIEWTDYSWNPVTGCFHKCRNSYCYNTIKWNSRLNRFGAEYLNENGVITRNKNWQQRETQGCHIAKKGEAYPFGYDPTFYPHRLKEPFSKKKPFRIFTVDTGDMFGAWVPAMWIEQVFDVIRRCPQHTFQLLTKNPKRYAEFEIPGNAWIGATITCDADKGVVQDLLRSNAKVKYLSIEPLVGEITIPFDDIQWIIVGAMTGKNPVVPKREWIERVIDSADKLNIPVFTKNNISEYVRNMRREFPKSDYSK